MITLQRSADRRYVRSGPMETWRTFGPGGAEPFLRGFRALGSLDEVQLLPGAEYTPMSEGNYECLTYVRGGSVTLRHRPRRDEIFGPGFYQRARSDRRMIAGRPDRYNFPGAHLFVCSMTLCRRDRSWDWKHCPFADRIGNLRLIASPDGSAGSLRLQQDVRVYSSALDPGYHVVHELRPGRGAWIHVVGGRVRLLGLGLSAGDGASLDEEVAVSLTAEEASEILLFDLA